MTSMITDETIQIIFRDKTIYLCTSRPETFLPPVLAHREPLTRSEAAAMETRVEWPAEASGRDGNGWVWLRLGSFL